MDTMTVLDDLQKAARKDDKLRMLLLATPDSEDPLKEFCRISRKYGFELYPMDVVTVGEEFYAAMRRSTNGGGENSPKLEGEDDFYELFLAGLVS